MDDGLVGKSGGDLLFGVQFCRHKGGSRQTQVASYRPGINFFVEASIGDRTVSSGKKYHENQTGKCALGDLDALDNVLLVHKRLYSEPKFSFFNNTTTSKRSNFIETEFVTCTQLHFRKFSRFARTITSLLTFTRSFDKI